MRKRFVSKAATTGNTFLGEDALFSRTEGINNTALGFQTLYNNTGGYDNTAIGYGVLHENTSGFLNTGIGLNALYYNTRGHRNIAVGLGALEFNTTGSDNTAVGHQSLSANTIGKNNIAIGFEAGSSITTGDNNIDIGNVGLQDDRRTIRLGDSRHTATFIAGISGATVPGGVGVVIDASGHVGTLTSSERFKDRIRPMEKLSEAIFSIQPVTFRYKKDLDPDGTLQFGLVAEQVEKVNPDLVARDEQGQPYTVRYEAVNAMLLNEFLKEHRKVKKQQVAIKQLESRVGQYEDLRSTVAQQQKQIQLLTATLKEQVSQIQKMSAQVDVSSRRAPKVVLNNQ